MSQEGSRMLSDKVHVYVACYSGTKESFLRQTLESINEQGIVPEYSYDERVTSEKWNEQLEKCTKPYLHLAHHDDIYRDGFYQETVAYLEAHPECSAVFTLDKEIDESNNVQSQAILPFDEQESYDFDFIFKAYVTQPGFYLRGPSVVLNMERIKGLRFPEDECVSACDTGFWFLCLTRGNIGIINKPLYLYRRTQHGDTARTVIGTVKQYDHVLALDFASRLRETDYRLRIPIVKGLEGRRDAVVAEAVENDARPMAFLVCHEPPDNAGTGVLVADRVRVWSGSSPYQARFVCPANGSGKFIAKGTATLTCHPNAFQDLVDEYRPGKIEYHHTLRWPIEILGVETDAEKELYLHDSHLWCDRWHSFDKWGSVCNEPNPKRCLECAGTDAAAYARKMEYLEKTLPFFSRIVANSAYTKKYADMYLGVNCVVEEPVPPELPHYRRRKRVGYFGGFYDVKGVHVLLNAWRKVMWGQLLLFCDVPAEYRKGAQIYGVDHVVCLGRYDRSDLPLLANLVDFAIVPSLNESFGLVRRELEQIGVRCLATSAGGLAGTIQPNDTEALARAIQEEIDRDE